MSVDVFRGATIAGMIVVNTPGDWGNVYAPLRHALWHGCTPTDLIFPFFVFIVGAGYALSTPDPRGVRWGRFSRRVAVLFALGLALNLLSLAAVHARGVPDAPGLESLRVMGVLQRIALCALGGAALLWLTKGRWLIPGLVTLAVYGGLLALHPLTPEENTAARVDRALLGAPRLYRGGPFDPEGLLSTLPAMVTLLYGYGAGRALRDGGAGTARVARRMAWAGAGAMAAGLAWSLWQPLNKPLWTPSYTLWTAGIAAVVLAGLSVACDRGGSGAFWRPWVAMGVNAIAVFVGSGIVARAVSLVSLELGGERVPVGVWVTRVMTGAVGGDARVWSLAHALVWLGVWWLVVWWMDRRGVRMKV